MNNNTFDLVVIGGGPGGYVAAIRASQLGLKVALIEKEHLGGICLNWGCIPTKALLKSAEIANYVKHAGDYGVSVSDFKIDIKKMVQRSRGVSNTLQNGVRLLLKKNKVQVIDGQAKLLAAGKISVGDKVLNAKNIIIATGARARIIKGLEADGKLILTYKEAMLQEQVPEKLAIVGAGAIGVEFASFYNALGSKVLLVEMQDRILATEDKEISQLAYKAFSNKGIEIHTNASLQITNKQTKIDIKIVSGDRQIPYQVDKIIVAAGVVGNVEDLGLENTKVKVANNQIKVDQYLMTDEPGIYAIGDVISPPWLAHKASHEGIMCVEKIAGHKVHPIIRENIPGCVYSNPQIASVGLTEEKAISLGRKIKVGRFPFMANGKALSLGEKDGLIKIIFDLETGEILGAHMFGHEVTELISTLVVAKNAELTEAELLNSIFAHPTLGEMIHESVLNAYGRAIHI